MKGLIPKICEIFTGDATNSPALLTGLAVGGVILTAVLAAKATPKAIAAIEAEEEERHIKAAKKAKKAEEVLHENYDEVYEEEFEPITRKDIVKIGFKYFIPPILSAGLTIACIVGAQHINTVRQAAMAASYELLRNSYDNYRSHVRDAVDKKKYEEIEHNIHTDAVNDILEKHPLTDQEYAKLDVGCGAALFCDSITGRRFVSTYEKVYRAVDDLNNRLSCDEGGGEDWIGVNEFLHMCGDESSGFGLSNIGFAPRVFAKRLDRTNICEPIVGEHNGHTCTIVYLNYEVDDKAFL